MLQKNDVAWGDWGIFSFDKFLMEFQGSEEFMRYPFDGYYSHSVAIDDFLNDRPSQDSACPELFIALFEFARRRVPHRVQDITGEASLYNPLRDNRAGARPSIPDRAPDIFKFILEGDEKKGHALVVEFDQPAGSLDNLLDDCIPLRKIGEVNAHAVSIVNKFPAYVRLMDDKLFRLLSKLGFMAQGNGLDSKFSTVTTIPFGINMVSFPFVYAESLSELPVFDVYATLKAAQNALKRGIKGSHNQQYDLFFNIEPLAGGTIPRIHVQTYLRTHRDAKEVHKFSEEALISLRDFSSNERITLGPPNRSWQAYAPPVKRGKYDVRLELRHAREKAFDALNDKELWDLGEQLVYHSRVLDEVIGIKARNIQIFPTGVIISPFAVAGGHEKAMNERIYGLPPFHFARQYNDKKVIMPKDLYRRPIDSQGLRAFNALVDEDCLMVRKAA